MLPQSLRDEFRLIETENVSAHPYPPEARTFIKETADAGGLVLDMGSGDQSYIDPSVICAEIVAYPATDILSVGQRLPFRDAVFDGVYTNAVLEHVTDPFTCAQELMRVLKPGGKVFCSVPFLQPEHGYPHHYYNMTQDGLTNLFTRLGASVIDKAVPAWGHPLYAGQWFLSAYLNYLPTEQRKRLEGLTVSDFLKLRRSEEEPAFALLSEEGMRVLACATYATFSKPA
ncbi:methyltransferase domain-containing protein [Ochrobactrum sp. Kaboul]|nr:methyltransferase domain-containing protein [Ochrobactrum sp. Kaboul]